MWYDKVSNLHKEARHDMTSLIFNIEYLKDFVFVGIINIDRTRKKVHHVSSQTLIVLRGFCLITETYLFTV